MKPKRKVILLGPFSTWGNEAHRIEITFSVKVKFSQSCVHSLQPHGPYSPWNFQARTLEWIAVPFSRASSQPSNWTQVSHIAGGFFTNWATEEAQKGAFVSPSGNPTQVSHVTGRDTDHYTKKEGATTWPLQLVQCYPSKYWGNLAPELIFAYGTLIVFHSSPRGSCSAHLHYVWDL